MKPDTDYPISNPDRILYPEEGITKLDLAEFYDEIQDWVLPYISYRPLTLVRCPQGNLKECFYQKHLNTTIPDGFYLIDIKEKTKIEKYFYIKDITGLLGLVQMGVLEIHPWGSRIDNIEKPDMITFDLDPDPEVAWKKVVDAAFLIKDELEKVGLKSFVKTTGGKGLHIVIPIKRYYEWDEIKSFSNTVVNHIVSLHPTDYIGTMSKAKRKGKIFIDYLRNQRGATAVAAYSTRAKLGATVSTPLTWDELKHSRIRSDSFNIINLPVRLKKLKNNPWEDFFRLKQSLKAIK